MKPIVKSPCINICTLDDAGNLCKGCFRTPEEIANWLYYSDEAKREVLVKLGDRKF